MLGSRLLAHSVIASLKISSEDCRQKKERPCNRTKQKPKQEEKVLGQILAGYLISNNMLPFTNAVRSESNPQSIKTCMHKNETFWFSPSITWYYTLLCSAVETEVLSETSNIFNLGISSCLWGVFINNVLWFKGGGVEILRLWKKLKKKRRFMVKNLEEGGRWVGYQKRKYIIYKPHPPYGSVDLFDGSRHFLTKRVSSKTYFMVSPATRRRDVFFINHFSNWKASSISISIKNQAYCGFVIPFFIE